MKPIVAIVGRPNVGKSTLFNRLIGEKRALVDDYEGVTRDRNYGDAEWYRREFTVVDTGGFDPVVQEGMLSLMREQATLAIEEADVILFVTDARDGLVPIDLEIASILRRTNKPVLVVGNKVEGNTVRHEAQELHGAGFGELYCTSAEHGDGVYDLMEAVVEAHPPARSLPLDTDEGRTRVAVIGKPNVGKSSLINRLLGEERLLASDVAGTTRDSIDTRLTLDDGREYLLIDTAGIRRKRAVSMRLEKFSVVKAFKSIERAHVVLLMLDGTETISSQDAKLASLIESKGRAVVVVVNKWDNVDKDSDTAGAYVLELRRQLPFLEYAPVVFTSALTGQRVSKVLDWADEVKRNASQRIKTGPLNRVLEEIIQRQPPPLHKRRAVKFYYWTQVAILPPTFVISSNMPEGVHHSYKRFMVGRLREMFNYEGTPIRLIFRKRGEDPDAPRKGKSKGRKGK